LIFTTVPTGPETELKLVTVVGVAWIEIPLAVASTSSVHQ
jgi:hypothetical protein